MKNTEEDRLLRIAARKCVARWLGFPVPLGSIFEEEDSGSHMHMARLFGFSDYHTLAQNQDEEINRKMGILAGPHGYTIWKAMLARQETKV